MKKYCSIIFSFLFCFIVLVGCSKTSQTKAIELMGAGDRIHDTFTFANTGVEISDDGKNIYTISGSVEKLENADVKKEFNIAEDVSNVVAIKLSAIGEDVKKEEVQISVDGVRNYDAEHLNGSNYTFIILEAIADKTVTITVKWNNNAEEKTYIVYFASNLTLK